jgi:DNA-binding MarR family transcriptional regulator
VSAADDRHTELVERVMAAYERMMQILVMEDAPDFGDVGITMAQAKVLFILSAGPVHMSELVARLRVTPSTTSGLVEKLVEQGLAARADDPGDRRQVIVSVTPAGLDLMERFRELNSRQLRALLQTLPTSDLDVVERSLTILRDATARRHASAGLPPATNHPSTSGTDQGSAQ